MSTATPVRKNAGTTRTGSRRRRSHCNDTQHSTPSRRARWKVVARHGWIDSPKRSDSAAAKRPDRGEIMGQFAYAISMVIVSQRSLAALELAEAGDEDATLQQAIVQLRTVYNELDALSR